MTPKPVEIPHRFDPRAIDRFVRAAGVPEMHAATPVGPLFAHHHWAEAYAALARSLEFGRDFQVLRGQRGTGKTQMAACLIRAACAEGVRPMPRYYTLRDLWSKAKAAMGVEGAGLDVVLDRAKRSAFLVLDEIGQADWTEWEQREFTALIDWRYGNCPGPTILISNDTASAAAERFGKSVMSRVAQRGNDHELAGWDFRAGAGVGA